MALSWFPVQSLLLLIVLIPTCYTYGREIRDASQRGSRRVQRSVTCSVDCSRSKRRPICVREGSVSRTLPSRCELRRLTQCDGKRLSMAGKGPCPEVSKCFKERAIALRKAKAGEPVHVTECKPDGTFAKVQCTPLIKTCWCVDEDGNPETGTSVVVKDGGKKPSCKGKPSKRRSGNRKSRRGCKKHDQAKFNKNLIAIFTQEYTRIPKPSNKAQSRGKGLPIQAGSDAILDTLEKRVIAWKFSELDLNKDNTLRSRETKTLQRMVKKLIKPRNCARHFIKNCDLNRDKAVSRSEWSVCLGNKVQHGANRRRGGGRGGRGRRPPLRTVPIDQPSIRPAKTRLGPPSLIDRQSGLMISDSSHLKPSPTLISKPKSCREVRAAALKDDRAQPQAKIFIPDCDPSGQYERAQCHTYNKSQTVCWCVDTVEGKPIKGSMRKESKPKCNKMSQPKKARALKGCPGDKKRQFIIALLDHMTTEMVAYANSNSNDKSKLPIGHPDWTLEEKVVTWKFNVRDKNGNGILDKKEVRAFKKELRKTKSLKSRCGRHFVKYCDKNNNKKITMDELKECMGLTDSPGPPVTPTASHVLKKSNPFMQLLTR